MKHNDDEMLTCDRCGNDISGFAALEGTVGFYRVNEEPWLKYRRGEEVSVCDKCMHADPLYRQDYAHIFGDDDDPEITVDDIGKKKQ